MSDGGESEDGGSSRRAAKKRKASRACDRCNSQHQPCDNASPKCGVCVRAGTDCTYNRPVRKRGPRSGYTGQNGERLWAIALRARPDIEDVVIQALRAGTYADTGVPNLEYYRNNDNQAELVGWFNESRLGRFLQHGEAAASELNLPPLDEEVPLALPLVSPFHRGNTVPNPSSRSNNNSNHNSNNIGLRQQPNPTIQALPHHQQQQQHARRMSTSSGANSVIVVNNPHGAPQNPSDIYLQSEDIRRRAFISPPPPQHDAVPYRGSSALHALSLGFGTVNGYNFNKTHSLSNNSEAMAAVGMPSYHNNSNTNHIPTILPHSSGAGQENEHGEAVGGSSELDTSYHSRWLDSIPRDTLLNLGFAPGDGMEEDFFELCANPDPIDSTPTNSADGGQGEDEEDVWRRLVLRGRFT
ncbi:hypothetical protein F5Y17DRAFT_152445 [Xylariaceae sp. FL0594]|nr:hypothetical protein F5Y17DRAFT_152445 [Xylariaceae sp. FL0594]